MKERPILFSGAMVRAILDGSKTQTRRVMKVQPPGEGYITALLTDSTFSGDRKNIGKLHWLKLKENRLNIEDSGESYFVCPYGQIGDRLWVRETFSKWDDGVVYAATCSEKEMALSKFKPSIHMPRWASRITLEIVNIRVERLKDISEKDAKAEGAADYEEGIDSPPPDDGDYCWSYVASFKKLWESINCEGSWNLNPWVWVIEFKRV